MASADHIKHPPSKVQPCGAPEEPGLLVAISLGGVEGQGIFKILDVRTKKKKIQSLLQLWF